MSQDDARAQTDVVMASIRSMIRDGELRAGDRLPPEKDLGARLAVSRGSLREGVRALAALGILETRQGDGTYVTPLDARRLLQPVGVLAELVSDVDARHLLTVRRAIEAESAALAATHASTDDVAALHDALDDVARLLADDAPLADLLAADSRFHRLVAAASGNPALAALVDQLVVRTLRPRLDRAATEHGAVVASLDEHRDVLAAIERRDPERARLHMQVHLLGVEDYVDGTAEPVTGPGRPGPPAQARPDAQARDDQ